MQSIGNKLRITPLMWIQILNKRMRVEWSKWGFDPPDEGHLACLVTPHANHRWHNYVRMIGKFALALMGMDMSVNGLWAVEYIAIQTVINLKIIILKIPRFRASVNNASLSALKGVTMIIISLSDNYTTDLIIKVKCICNNISLIAIKVH